MLLGPIDPAIEGAQAFIVGTLSGAVALICAFRFWTQVRSIRLAVVPFADAVGQLLTSCPASASLVGHARPRG